MALMRQAVHLSKLAIIANPTAGLASTQYCAHVQQHYCKAMVPMHEPGCINASVSECRLAHAVHVLVLTWHPTVIVIF